MTLYGIVLLLLLTTELTWSYWSSKLTAFGPLPIRYSANGKCIGVDYYNDLYLYDCNGENDQLWTLDASGLIRNAADNGLCVASDGGWPKLITCDSQNTNQIWTVTPYKHFKTSSMKIMNNENCLSLLTSDRLKVQECGTNDHEFVIDTTSQRDYYHEIKPWAKQSKCLDKYAADNSVHLYSCNEDDNQQWTYSVTTGAIKNKANGQCLDVWSNKENWDGAAVKVYDCNGGRNQKFVITKNKIINPQSGKCLDVNANDVVQNVDGTIIRMYDCWGGFNQRWTFPSRHPIKSFNGKCLETSLTGSVQLYDCDESADKQKWYWDDNIHTITNEENKKCLGIINDVVTTYDCNTENDQKWMFDRYEIRHENGKCLDVNRDDFIEKINGASVSLYDCWGSDNQKWKSAIYRIDPVVCTGDHPRSVVDWDAIRYPGQNDFGLNIYARTASKSQYPEDCFLRYSNYNDWADASTVLDDFIDASDDIVVFIHGWQKTSQCWKVDSASFETSDVWSRNVGSDGCQGNANNNGNNDIDGNCPPSEHDAQYWIKNGFNVIFLDWKLYASENAVMPVGAQNKIYKPVYSGKNVPELLFDKLEEMLGMVNWQGNELRLVGHSLGGQVALNLASKWKLESAYADKLTRVALLDAQFMNPTNANTLKAGGLGDELAKNFAGFGPMASFDIQSYIGTDWSGEYARNVLLPNIRGMNGGVPAIVESYRTSQTHMFNDENLQLYERTMFVELKPWYYCGGHCIPVDETFGADNPLINLFELLSNLDYMDNMGRQHNSALASYMHCMKFKENENDEPETVPNCRMDSVTMTNYFNNEWCQNQREGGTGVCETKWDQDNNDGVYTTWDTDDTFFAYTQFVINAVIGVGYVVEATIDYTDGNGNSVTWGPYHASAGLNIQFKIPMDATHIWVNTKAVGGAAIFRKYYGTPLELFRCNNFDVWGTTFDSDYANTVGGPQWCNDK